VDDAISFFLIQIGRSTGPTAVAWFSTEFVCGKRIVSEDKPETDLFAFIIENSG
jgi:hypothetical protein